jgi:acyl carrier protein
MMRKFKSIFSKARQAEIREDEAAIAVDDELSVERKIKAIMAKVFKIGIDEVDEDTSADDVDQWNSLAHVDFLVALQKEFDIEFTDSQLVEMLSYKAVVQGVTTAIEGSCK